MFKTNLKIAWRNLEKGKQFMFINVFGLAAFTAQKRRKEIVVRKEIGA
jgi:hypothetical protein